MRRVFADAQYWVALLNEKDQSHATAQAISQTLQGVTVFTTEEVLSELAAYFSGHGRYLRQAVAAFIDAILIDPALTLRPQSHQSFLDGFAFYKARPDKGYSLTDCSSMEAMRREGISEVLTHDSHFAQEGIHSPSLTMRNAGSGPFLVKPWRPELTTPLGSN